MRAILRMGPVLAAIAVIAGASATSATAAARRPSKPPTAAQVRAAVRRVEHSRDLWATVNICHRPRFGIRGQMPALGFKTSMTMKFQVDYWNSARNRFVPDRHLRRRRIWLGLAAHDLHQDGWVWRFKNPVMLSGNVTFEWRLGGKLIGSTTRQTARGVKGVDDTDPKGNSTATCRIM